MPPASTRDGPPAPDVFAYLDYRAYLTDYYEAGKARFGLSYRGLAKRVGVRSPSFLKLVMEGRRNLSVETARRVAKACELEGNAVDYFVALVRFNQTEDPEVRRTEYRRIQRFDSYRRVQPLEVARDAYHSRWYYPAIREMVASPLFREDPEWIAGVLRPEITPAEAAEALEALEKLGLLTRDDEGRLQQAEALVSSGAETRSVHLANYHRTMMERGSRAIDEFPRELRDISSITLCVDEHGLRRLKERVQAIRQELLVEESFAATEPRQVVQLNFQLFPLTSRIDAAEDS